MTVDTHTGEVVAHMSATTARALTDEIRSTLTTAHDKLLDAWRGRADLALGYDSWDSYCAGEFAGQRMVRLDREQRREIVTAMRSEGMGTRAIGSALGVARNTVKDDLRSQVGQFDPPTAVQGTDGKTYPAPEPEVVDAEIVEDAQGTTSPTPRTPPRRALTAAFGDAAIDLRRAADRLRQLVADDRFTNNKEQIATENRDDLLQVLNVLHDVEKRLA